MTSLAPTSSSARTGRAASIVLAAIALTACSGSDAGDDGTSSSSGGSSSGTSTDPPPPAGAPDIRVRFRGRELAPQSTHAIELGTTRAGGFTPSVEIVLENPGGGPVTLGVPKVDGFAATVPETLAPGATATLTLAMLPAAIGAKKGSLVLTTSVPGKESYPFDLSGFVLTSTGVPLNPYWTTAPWKLWFDDPTAVTFTGTDEADVTHTLDCTTTDPTLRKFPSAAALAAAWPGPFVGLDLAPPAPAASGWWDDVSGTMDRGHSKPLTGYGGTGGNNINLVDQFIRIPFGTPSAPQRMAVGMTFTSESYAYRGHQLTRATGSVLDTERNWLFANTLRGSPSFMSYNEFDAVHATDNYDGLYAIGYHSLGRSGSETHALLKMLVAGGYMPRKTKELLKRHGLYATAMLTLFRQALPYVNEDGSPVEYEREMIQRPTYLSNGGGTTAEFAPNNIVYHQYNDTMHLYRMVQGAKALTTAPPVGVMKLVDVASSVAGGAPTKWAPTDPRVKVRGKTMTTVWVDPGETLDVRVDLGESIDLEGGELDFSAKAVYPNQERAITIEREGKTAIFHVRAVPDSKLPLGRFPIVLQAHARGLRSNPMFLNVFFRQPDQEAIGNGYFDATRNTGGYGQTNDKRKAVFWNARPLLTTSLGAATTIAGAIGAPVTFTVSCVDPEGFPTKIYRRADDRGTFAKGTFSFTPTASGTFGASFICSDGTGAFESVRISVEVP